MPLGEDAPAPRLLDGRSGLMKRLAVCFRGERRMGGVRWQCLTCSIARGTCHHVQAVRQGGQVEPGPGRQVTRGEMLGKIDEATTEGGQASVCRALSTTPIPDRAAWKDSIAWPAIRDRAIVNLGEPKGRVRCRGTCWCPDMDGEVGLWWGPADGLGEGQPPDLSSVKVGEQHNVRGDHECHECTSRRMRKWWSTTRVWHTNGVANLLLLEAACDGCKTAWRESSELGIFRWTAQVAYTWELIDDYWRGCLQHGTTFVGYWRTYLQRVRSVAAAGAWARLESPAETASWQDACINFAILQQPPYEDVLRCHCAGGRCRQVILDGKLVSFQSHRAHFWKPHQLGQGIQEWDQVPSTRPSERILVPRHQLRAWLSDFAAQVRTTLVHRGPPHRSAAADSKVCRAN